MQFTYPKKEKLKSKTTIDLLFSEGNSVSKFPLRLVYVENKEPNAELMKMGVSVSKKYFKKSGRPKLFQTCFTRNVSFKQASFD